MHAHACACMHATSSGGLPPFSTSKNEWLNQVVSSAQDFPPSELAGEISTCSVKIACSEIRASSQEKFLRVR
jgi:hypothetical protein